MSGNRLRSAPSPYLASAAHQPVDWFPWGDEAFARARAENKPVLLDIGAVWCHWCHVMDGESYENPETAALINEHFIAVKVDRDERPDVDARYQRAVQAMSGQGGWPLTVFLTSDGVPFYGATYLPPVARYGRAGFPQVLTTVASAYRENRVHVEEQATSLANYLREQVMAAEPLDVTPEVISAGTQSIMQAFDEVNGGFGMAPKFPHPSAIEFLFARYRATRDDAVKRVIVDSLHAMANGGIYDQLGGGFHRYSTDEKWIVPHFEKMLYDNTELLRNYVHAYASFREPFFREIAEGIVQWMDTVLSDRAQGGFYGSQDADRAFGDDGSYFTWTMNDARDVLTPAQFAVAQAYYNIYEEGEMHIDKSQNVLFVDRPVDAIAGETGMSVDEVTRLRDEARAALRAARDKRETPFVDPTMYVGWNAMAVTAYLEAGRFLGRADCTAFALRTLDRLLAEGFTPEGSLRHTLAPDAPTDLMDDYAHLVAALLAAHEATGEHRYLSKGLALVSQAITLFYDAEGGGFFDRARSEIAPGILDLPHKQIQDSPSPSGNAVMCRALLAAHWWSGDDAFMRAAENTMRHFVKASMGSGLFAAEFFHAVDEYITPPTHVIVIGDPADPRTTALWNAAREVYVHGASVVRCAPGDARLLPPAVRPMAGASAEPAAYICSGTQCSAPCKTAADVRQALHTV